MEKGERLFRSLLESAAEGFIVVDSEGGIVITNARAEELFGYSREEMLCGKVEMLVPERFREIHLRHRKDYLDNPRNRPMGTGFDLFARRSDGSEFPVEISLSKIGDSEELLIMASVSDISRRKEWEEEKTRFLQERIRKLETTLRALDEIAEPCATAVSSNLLGITPLRESSPDLFAKLVGCYCGIMDKALEQKVHGANGSIPEHLANLAEQLGFLKATPRDVVEVHSAALKRESREAPPARIRGYLEEGHFLLVELLGYLVTYYRNHALGTHVDGKREL